MWVFVIPVNAVKPAFIFFNISQINFFTFVDRVKLGVVFFCAFVIRQEALEILPITIPFQFYQELDVAWVILYLIVVNVATLLPPYKPESWSDGVEVDRILLVEFCHDRVCCNAWVVL